MEINHWKINIHKTSRNFILGIKVEGYQYEAAETASAGRPKHNKRVRKERWTRYCKMRVVSINLGVFQGDPFSRRQQ
ncbi:hypothetical protein EYC84_004269 [Monilinia fructicola]|uniref:Uncharacterized protein n=1 Tax=Monilinia fructicola TaxID=38448 RepID=A0A5M9K3L7_MONFR|nr:hypothetical protein EYC84_004269 [Monilinia fructicola]